MSSVWDSGAFLKCYTFIYSFVAFITLFIYLKKKNKKRVSNKFSVGIKVIATKCC